MGWLERWRARRAERKETERLLRQNGFIAYCACRTPLNEARCEALGDDTYVYTCPGCGRGSRFLFGPPAPVLLEETGPSDLA